MKYRMIALMLMFPLSLQAADCTNDRMPPSTDESVDFVTNSNGTLIDQTTDLMWMRCAVGQTWSDATASCSGNATQVSWDKALLAAKSNSFAGFSDWRLPNINELRSIVEDCRTEPAINRQLFPNAPGLKFWSSSTYVGSPGNSWVIDFGLGRDNFELKSKVNALRLVRINK